MNKIIDVTIEFKYKTYVSISTAYKILLRPLHPIPYPFLSAFNFNLYF